MLEPISPKCIHPYLNTVAQLIECVHSLEESIRILEEFKKSGLKIEEKKLFNWGMGVCYRLGF